MTLCIVTGANRGLGLALARALKEQGKNVLAACRKNSEALSALGVEVVTDVDVATSEGVRCLSDAVGNRQIELLINNAGILVWGDSLGKVDYEGMERQFKVNAIGPLRVTEALTDRLSKGSKVALITSRMGSVEDNGSGGVYGYRASKAALNIVGKSLAMDLKARGVPVIILHPGMVKTDMVGEHGQVEPEDAAAGLLSRISELSLDSTGDFRHANGEKLPW